MAVLSTINVGGADFEIRDSTARSQANQAISTTNQITNNSLPAKKDIPINVAGNALSVNPDLVYQQSDLYYDQITTNLPTGAHMGVRNIYRFDRNSIMVELVDVRRKKIYRNYYWSESGWQGWEESGTGALPDVLTIMIQNISNNQGYTGCFSSVGWDIIKNYNYLKLANADEIPTDYGYSFYAGADGWHKLSKNQSVAIPDKNTSGISDLTFYASHNKTNRMWWQAYSKR